MPLAVFMLEVGERNLQPRGKVMNHPGRAIIFSLVLHALIITTVLAASHYIPVKEPLISFYFDILTAPLDTSVKTTPVKAIPIPKRNNLQPSEVRTLAKRTPEKEAVPQEAPTEPTIMTQPETPLIETGEGDKTSPWVQLPGKVVLAELQDAASGTTSASPGAATGDVKGSRSTGEEKTSYLRNHFTYIKDRIIKNVNYPEAARRMSWEGKVVVSFVVKLDGSVTDIKINQSSGVAVLDKNACETIAKTAPFPKPPIPARMIIPLVYRLN
jgi:periplasmic protein TonB